MSPPGFRDSAITIAGIRVYRSWRKLVTEISIWGFSDRFRVFEGINQESDVQVSKRYLANHDGEWSVPVLRNANEQGVLKPTGDFPATTGFSHLISERAIDLIGSLFERSGELLPVEIEDRDLSSQFYLFRCTKVIDCLHAKKSEVTYVPWDPEEIAHIKDSVFVAERLPDEGLFVVPEKQDGHIYVTEEIRLAVKRNALRGMVLTRKPFGDEPAWVS